MLKSWIVISFIGLAVPVAAQSNLAPAPFEVLRLSVSLPADVADTPFHDRWTPELGLRFEAETPFHVGEFRFGVHAFKNSARTENVPGFRVVFAYLGWAWAMNLGDRIATSAGVSLGNFLMDFADRPFEDISETESELAMGLEGRIRIPARSRWAVVIGGEYRTVYTERRIEYGFVTAGLVWTLSTPEWLKDFLQ